MKLEFDYENKIVTIKGKVSLKEAINAIKLAVDNWEEWEVMPEVIWNTFPVYPSYPVYPSPIITYIGDPQLIAVSP